MRLIGIIADRTSFCFVAFSVSAARAKRIPHRWLKSSGVVFKFCYDDKKARGCMMLVGLFGGSGTVVMCLYFTSCSFTSLATC